MADESVILDQKSAFNMCLDMPGGTLPIVRSPEDAMDLAYAVRNQLGNLSTDVLNLITFCKKIHLTGSDSLIWMGMRQVRPANDGSACEDSACDNKNLVWTDGTTFAFDADIFPSVSFNLGELCTIFDSATRGLKSIGCNLDTGAKVFCQLDCATGNPCLLQKLPIVLSKCIFVCFQLCIIALWTTHML